MLQFVIGDLLCPGDQVDRLWRFGLRPGTWASETAQWSDPVAAVWGYDELVDDPEHAAALQEREPNALAIVAVRLEAVRPADGSGGGDG